MMDHSLRKLHCSPAATDFFCQKRETAQQIERHVNRRSLSLKRSVSSVAVYEKRHADRSAGSSDWLVRQGNRATITAK